MKNTLFILICLMAIGVHGQDPVSWTFGAEITDDGGTISMTASIEEGWHIYGLTLENDMGPLPTVVVINEEGLEWSELHVPTPKEKYDDMFMMNVTYYETEVSFTRAFTGKADTITGSVEFMVCNDEMCLPPTTVPFEVISLDGR